MVALAPADGRNLSDTIGASFDPAVFLRQAGAPLRVSPSGVIADLARFGVRVTPRKPGEEIDPGALHVRSIGAAARAIEDFRDRTSNRRAA